ncbi:hypothetical protein KUCAC02_028738, partial [Chaenocephalus aceratus]
LPWRTEQTSRLYACPQSNCGLTALADIKALRYSCRLILLLGVGDVCFLTPFGLRIYSYQRRLHAVTLCGERFSLSLQDLYVCEPTLDMEDYDVRSAASIMASVKEQEARFEQLTRAPRGGASQCHPAARPRRPASQHPHQPAARMAAGGDAALANASGTLVSWPVLLSMRADPLQEQEILHPPFVELNTACSSVQCTLGVSE